MYQPQKTISHKIEITPLIRSNSNNEELLKEAINDSLSDNTNLFYPIFAALVDEEARENLDTDSFIVTDVQFNENKQSGLATLECSYSCYMGCDDLDSSGEREHEIEFKVVNNTILINENIPNRWKSI